MFCCARNVSRQYSKQYVLIHAPPPSNPAEYLPKLNELHIQNEPKEVIDDPSCIFFDPDEKPGFIYKAVPKEHFEYDAYAETFEQPSIVIKETSTVSKPIDSPATSEFDDSLDMINSMPNSPGNVTNESFDRHFGTLSRRNSLELDPMGAGTYTSLLNENFNANENSGLVLEPATDYSEGSSKRMYSSRHGDNDTENFAEMQLYDDVKVFNETRIRNKGYISDAESVKTYQDSGICEDEVESPKPLSNEDLARGSHTFTGEKDLHRIEFSTGVDDRVDIEKFSPFKTPNSSRNNSPETEHMATNIESERGRHKKTKKGHSRTRSKCASKYSHIQAKVETHRSRGDRSVSPAASFKKRTQEKPVLKPMIFSQPNSSKTNRPSSKEEPKRVKSKPSTTSKSPSSSFSNGTHTGTAGPKKIFRQALNFRQKAEPRIDTHGVEMYSHLPKEFQEIARRLARQDQELKKQDSGRPRGRSVTRSQSSSTAASSRASSVSPSRGRSRTRKDKRASNANSDQDEHKTLESPAKSQTSVSRSSSIRSIPSTPHLSLKHPATAAIPYDNRRTPKSRPSSPFSPTRSVSPRRSRSNSRSNSRPGSRSHSPKSTKAKSPSSPVSQLFQFSQSGSFGSPKIVGQPLMIPAVR